MVLGNALPERVRRKTRELALLGHTRGPFRQITQAGSLRDEICQLRHPCGDTRPPVNVAKRVSRRWPEAVFIIVREKLRLVSRHIDTDGTIVLASFACQTEIERFLDRRALPTLLNDLSLKHLEQETRPPAGGMFLLPRHHEARAH